MIRDFGEFIALASENFRLVELMLPVRRLACDRTAISPI
jgi:hypothetical protein